MKRREFLKLVGVAGGGVVLSGCQGVVEGHPIVTVTKVLEELATKTPTPVDTPDLATPTLVKEETVQVQESPAMEESTFDNLFSPEGRIAGEDLIVTVSRKSLDLYGIESISTESGNMDEVMKVTKSLLASALAQSSHDPRLKSFLGVNLQSRDDLLVAYEENEKSENPFDYQFEFSEFTAKLDKMEIYQTVDADEWLKISEEKGTADAIYSSSGWDKTFFLMENGVMKVYVYGPFKETIDEYGPDVIALFAMTLTQQKLEYNIRDVATTAGKGTASLAIMDVLGATIADWTTTVEEIELVYKK